MNEPQPYLLLHADTRTGQYFKKLYQHFEPEISAYYKDLPDSPGDYDTLYQIAAQLSFDADGRFVLRQINSKENLPAAILLYIAGAHLLVEHSNMPGLQSLFGYYKLKSAARYRWGNVVSPLFEYVGILLQYAKRTLGQSAPVKRPYDARLVFLAATGETE